MRSVRTITLGLLCVALAWAPSARAATIVHAAAPDARGTDDLGDGLPAFPQTLLADASNLRASRAQPQPDYDDERDMGDASRYPADARMEAGNAASLYGGFVYDSLSPQALSGATIVLARPGHRYPAKTNRYGYFTIGPIPSGSYMLSVSKSAAYATLHAMVAVRAGRTEVRLRLLVLSGDERAWMNQLAYERADVAYPRTRELGTDQYAVLIARELAADVSAGRVPFSDATEERYAARYAALPGAVDRAAVSGAIVPAPGDYLSADRLWMAEKANCPEGDWQICPFAGNTGHYINISSGLGVWMGIGESARSFSYLGFPGYNAYYVLTIES
jgi:hypothetical protein